MSKKEPSYGVNLFAGGCAGLSVDVALFPIDTVKTRLQSPLGFWKAGGFKDVYKGLLPVTIGSAPGAALFFVTYEASKGLCDGTVGVVAAASMGEAIACFVRVPVENVKQKMQAGMYATMLDTTRAIIREGGQRNFYTGYGTTLLREIPFSIIQFPLYEKFKVMWGEVQGSPTTPTQGSLCGSAAGIIAAAATTPIDVVKTRLMLGKDSNGVPYAGTIDTFKRVYAEGGVTKLFSGLSTRVMWIGIGGFIYFGAWENARVLLMRQREG